MAVGGVGREETGRDRLCDRRRLGNRFWGQNPARCCAARGRLTPPYRSPTPSRRVIALASPSGCPVGTWLTVVSGGDDVSILNVCPQTRTCGTAVVPPNGGQDSDQPRQFARFLGHVVGLAGEAEDVRGGSDGLCTPGTRVASRPSILATTTQGTPRGCSGRPRRARPVPGRRRPRRVRRSTRRGRTSCPCPSGSSRAGRGAPWRGRTRGRRWRNTRSGTRTTPWAAA